MDLTGRRVALTGSLPGLERADVRRRLIEAGATFVPIVDETVDVLIVGEGALGARVAQARRQGIALVGSEALEGTAVQAPVRGEDEGPELGVVDEAGRPPVVRAGQALTVLDLRLPRRASEHALVPAAERFLSWTLDEATLGVVHAVARATLLRQACLLEGPTAATKTSAVLWLASELGQPVARVNLNGQTDASELIGRYVPADGGGWRFAEGMVPRALREGWWLLLDEVNLAEPAVLERLNPVLERTPTLVLTEGPGTRFGPGGVPVHPDFRVFATMNPASYQGRAVLSPAWRDRFGVTRIVPGPDEGALLAMLRRAVLGVQPAVRWAGVRWPGSSEAPTHGALAALPGVEGLLQRLAAAWVGAARMATPTDGEVASIGARRREPPVFTRRGLLGLLDALRDLERIDPRTGASTGVLDEPVHHVHEALQATFLERLDDPDDRTRLHHLLEALGLDRPGLTELLT